MTPTHPRDPEMDPLLARALSDRHTSGAACVDAETMAAWMDRGLASQLAAEVEGHVSSCSRCQALLAALVRSAPEPLRPASLWQSWHLKWLVPVAGAAAAVTLFVATRPAVSPVPESIESRVELAGEPPPTPAAPPARPSPSQERAQQPRSVERTAPLSKAGQSGAAANAQEGAAAPPAPQAQTFEARREAPAAVLESTRADQSSAPAPAAPAAGQRAAAGAAERTLSASLPIEVRSPVAMERWRILTGLVEHTADAGATWQPVAASELAGIRAGSSPAAGVCWLVGSGGGAWLTTNGRQFVRVSFPESIDLISVSATSDRSATITAADGRLFRTDDRGASWRQ